MLVVDNMSLREMYTELVNDGPNVTAKVEYLCNNFRRNVLKRTRFPVQFKPVDYVSPKKNKWIIIFTAKSKKDAETPAITYVCTANARGGIYVFMISLFQGDPCVLMFPPHFFQRYRDRFMEGNNDIKGIDLIKYFFCRNPTFSSDESVEDKRIFQTSCEDGVCLGIEKEKNIFIQRTFITYEMLKNDQIDTFESLYDSLHDGEE